jgi:4-deoxy-L-threo-5-hexosulose-uronate ketol-isomerase
VRDREVVLSPSWSVHAGVGTGSYRFIWAMGGDNQTFSDMDQIPLSELR